MSARILLWDIETAPATTYTWGRWKQNIGGNQVLEEGYFLCWAARFLDESEVYFDSLPQHKTTYKKDPRDDSKICASLIKLMEGADILVAQNGDKFDLKWLNTQLAKHQLSPIPVQKTIDTLKLAKNQFRFPSNRLDELAKYLNIPTRKEKMEFDDWRGCMDGDAASWEKMVSYNCQDIEVLAEVYLRLRPYVKGHPNLAMYQDFPGDAQMKCPKCESELLVKNGFYVTNISKFRRYRCTSCGNRQIRAGANLFTADERREIVRPT